MGLSSDPRVSSLAPLHEISIYKDYYQNREAARQVALGNRDDLILSIPEHRNYPPSSRAIRPIER
jgi:hypothetical protein